jgi:predicted ATPase
MRALYASGRQADALSVYAAARNRLRDELGLEPSAALRDLHQRLLAQTEPVAPVAPQQPKQLAPVPALLDETIGREADLDALTRLVTTGNARMISILGPGGVGKTRVATLLGQGLGTAFRDGVVFVPIADAQTADDVGSALCAALGLQVDDGGAWSTVERHVRGRHCLLICDNFEHVVDAAPALIRLLNAAPEITVVVTSRQRLDVRSEHVYWLEPLPHTTDRSAAAGDDPDAASVAPAVALFLARARAVDPSFDPGPAELADAAAICASCDGLPLAIELAAARTRVFAVADLREAMGSALDVLAGGARDAPARHQTLRATIEASVETIDEHLRRFLAALSVFHGGFTMAAAAAVADVHVDRTLDALDALIGQSLVQRRTDHSGRRRFDLLATIREYLHERTAPELLNRVRRRHARYYHQLMGPVPDARYARTAAHWAALLPERPNIRAAVRWARDLDDPHLFAELVNAAGGLWLRLGPRDEFEDWLEHTIEDPRTAAGRVVDALVRRAYLEVHVGDLGAATEDVERADVLARTADPIRRAWVHTCAALVRLHAGDRAGAVAARDLALRTMASATVPAELRWYILQVGVWLVDDEARRRTTQEEILQFSLAHDLYPLTGQALNNSCEIELEHGDYARVIALAEQGMRLTLEAEDVGRYGWLISQRGLARLETGDLDGAGSDLRTALKLAQGRSLGSGLESVLRLAAWCVRAGRLETAAVLVGAFDAASDPKGGWRLLQRVRERYLEQLPAQLGPAYDDAVRRGRELAAGDREGVLTAALRLLDEPVTTVSH